MWMSKKALLILPPVRGTIEKQQRLLQMERFVKKINNHDAKQNEQQNNRENYKNGDFKIGDFEVVEPPLKKRDAALFFRLFGAPFAFGDRRLRIHTEKYFTVWLNC